MQAGCRCSPGNISQLVTSPWPIFYCMQAKNGPGNWFRTIPKSAFFLSRSPEWAKKYWLVVWTPLKNISQLGWLFPIYGKIENVPNHQPEKFNIAFSPTTQTMDVVPSWVMATTSLDLPFDPANTSKTGTTTKAIGCKTPFLWVQREVLGTYPKPCQETMTHPWGTQRPETQVCIICSMRWCPPSWKLVYR